MANDDDMPPSSASKPASLAKVAAAKPVSTPPPVPVKTQASPWRGLLYFVAVWSGLSVGYYWFRESVSKGELHTRRSYLEYKADLKGLRELDREEERLYYGDTIGGAAAWIALAVSVVGLAVTRPESVR